MSTQKDLKKRLKNSKLSKLKKHFYGRAVKFSGHLSGICITAHFGLHNLRLSIKLSNMTRIAEHNKLLYFADKYVYLFNWKIKVRCMKDGTLNVWNNRKYCKRKWR